MDALGLLLVVPLAILSAILIEDLRRYRIRNALVLLLAAAFVLDCLARDRADLLLPHALFALVGILALVGAFAAGWLGGGDAKLLAAALFWVGPEQSFLFALCLGAASAAYVVGARCGLLPARRRYGRLQIPYGVSISSACAATLLLAHIASPA